MSYQLRSDEKLLDEIVINITTPDSHLHNVCVDDSLESAKVLESRRSKRKRGVPASTECEPQCRTPPLKRPSGGDMSLPLVVAAPGSGTECSNFANPLLRAQAIFDATAAIFSAEQTATGHMSRVLAGCATRSLGSGINGQVWSAELGGRSYAVKVIKSGLRGEEMSAAERRETVIEARVEAFLTRKVLNVNNPTLSRCPNFVASFAYELTETVPLMSRKRPARAIWTPNCSCVNVTETFQNGSAISLALPQPDGQIAYVNALRSPKLAFSLIAQVLVAISCMSSIGLSHNDLSINNVVAQATPTRTLVYEFPGAESTPSELGALAINSQGFLFAVCDFGLASCNDWELAGDKRFDAETAHLPRHRRLGAYYWPETASVKPPKRRSLMTSDALDQPVHVLRCDIDVLERDVAFFLSTVAVFSSDCKESQLVHNFARAALREFDVPGRLQTPEQLTRIVRRVLSPPFTAQHFGAAISDFYMHDVRPYTHVYRLPSPGEAMSLARSLVSLLQSDIEPQTLVRVVE